ncbi:hypothetical protein J40TS1_14190 [Paenibacillus montaniterrae]|uniref:Uncharacterized protein n=1 Tax=Paenibacillus montaniterrae TaxID=429341 RepID=A0A919YM81_9BACL|nr:hypothetical protein [Paenibacillus montaniterrae]GIP15777.1 hypothetical protein J40TS1_14190 [Paenibacillus montaniterrae]
MQLKSLEHSLLAAGKAQGFFISTKALANKSSERSRQARRSESKAPGEMPTLVVCQRSIATLGTRHFAVLSKHATFHT